MSLCTQVSALQGLSPALTSDFLPISVAGVPADIWKCIFSTPIESTDFGKFLVLNKELSRLIYFLPHAYLIDINPAFKKALLCSNALVVRLLLKNPLLQFHEGTRFSCASALQKACKTGDTEMVRSLLPTGCIKAYSQSHGLWEAAENGHIEIMKLLLAHENVDVRLYGSGALWRAVGKGHVEIAKLLLGAKSFQHGWWFESTLKDAIRGGHFALATQLLADDRAPILKDVHGVIKAMGTSRTPSTEWANFVDYVLNYPQFQDFNCFEPLMCDAVDRGAVDVLRHYLSHLGIYLQGVLEEVLIYALIFSGNGDVIQLLANDPRVDWAKALRIAKVHNCVSTVRELQQKVLSVDADYSVVPLYRRH